MMNIDQYTPESVGEVAPISKVRVRHGSIDHREKMAAIGRRRWDDPEFRAKQMANPNRKPQPRKARWDNDAEYREQMKINLRHGAGKQSPESVAKRAAKLRANWQDPEFRAKQMANTKRCKPPNKEQREASRRGRSS